MLMGLNWSYINSEFVVLKQIMSRLLLDRNVLSLSNDAYDTQDTRRFSDL
jgi:hypothetical protein